MIPDAIVGVTKFSLICNDSTLVHLLSLLFWESTVSDG